MLANVPPATVRPPSADLGAQLARRVRRRAADERLLGSADDPGAQLARRDHVAADERRLTLPRLVAVKRDGDHGDRQHDERRDERSEQIERPVLGACSVSTLALIVPSLRLCPSVCLPRRP